MFEDVVAKLNPAQVFSWTGRFDPEEGATKLRGAAQGILLALSQFPKPLPDSPMVHDELGHAAGLPGGKPFRMVRDALIATKLLERGNTQEGVCLFLTEKGRLVAKNSMDQLREQGMVDEEGKPVETEAQVRAREKRKRKKHLARCCCRKPRAPGVVHECRCTCTGLVGE